MPITTAPIGLWTVPAQAVWTGRTFGTSWSPMPTAAVAWPTANLAIYSPLVVPSPITIVKLFSSAGGTGTGTYDLGVYTAAGSRLVHAGGSTPASNIEAVADITDTFLPAGLYYMAQVCSNNTDTWFAVSIAVPGAVAGGHLVEQLGSASLPTTAGWSILQTLAVQPNMGAYLEPTPA